MRTVGVPVSHTQCCSSSSSSEIPSFSLNDLLPTLIKFFYELLSHSSLVGYGSLSDAAASCVCAEDPRQARREVCVIFEGRCPVKAEEAEHTCLVPQLRLVLQMRAGGRLLTVNWRERPSARTQSLHADQRETQWHTDPIFLRHSIVSWVWATNMCTSLFPWIKHGTLHLCATLTWTKTIFTSAIEMTLHGSPLNLDKTLMIIFHLCIQSSLYRLGSRVKTICYNLVPGKCKSTFQIRWNKNHAVHYILYS